VAYAELHSAVGALMGEQDCLRRLACLSGHRAAAVPGATAATMVLRAASSALPQSVRNAYEALYEAAMYSGGDCSQYVCDS